MISGPSIFRRTHRSLNLLGGAIFLALTMVYGSAYVRDSLKTKLAQSRGQFEAQQQILSKNQLDLSNIKIHIAQFQNLRKQGMVGVADREGWVEQLTTSRDQLNLSDTLSYTLKPPQAITDAASPDPGAVSEVEPGGAVQHDLDFELSGITEPELLSLLKTYKMQVHGLFRVQACRLTSPSLTGLTAQCTLRFFNLPTEVKPS